MRIRAFNKLRLTFVFDEVVVVLLMVCASVLEVGALSLSCVLNPAATSSSFNGWCSRACLNLHVQVMKCDEFAVMLYIVKQHTRVCFCAKVGVKEGYNRWDVLCPSSVQLSSMVLFTC